MSANLGMLVIAGVEIPIHTLSPFSQTYETIGGIYTRRMMSGGVKKQTNWEKIATSISAGGTIPPGLASTSFGAPYIMMCGAARSIRNVSNIITLPTRRSDVGFEPKGKALVGVAWEESPAVMVGDVATVAAVAGAEQYEVWYYPVLTVVSLPPNEDIDVSGEEYSWSLTAEEV